MKRLLSFYFAAAVFCVAGVVLTLRLGDRLFPVGAVADGTASVSTGRSALPSSPPAEISAASAAIAELTHKLTESWPRLLVQLVAIVLATWSVAAFFRRAGLPSVIGEILAGILLGPTLLGWLWPDAFNFLFQRGSLDGLKLFAQIGVTVFMFLAGTEFDVGYLRGNVRRTLVLSQVGILVPFLLGAIAALFLYRDYGGQKSNFSAFALFMAISMSITAFPVLVRMLEERGMIRSKLGVTALACAAIDDASAWTLLSVIVAFVTAHSMAVTVFKLGGLLLFIAAMLLVIRPRLARWLMAARPADEPIRDGVMAVVLLYMTISALTTELLGVHALFGAFVAGTCMPRGNRYCEHLALRLESFNRVLLLPLFFALSGVRTELGLLDTRGWLVCGVVILLASAGKLGGCMTAAKLGGMTWRDAMAFGALMNTRGLMELIVINLGYDLGILSPAMFSILVIMALVTTFLTGPLLKLTERRRSVPTWEPSPAPLPAHSRG